jgi:DNA-binding response OmpR family regulator
MRSLICVVDRQPEICELTRECLERAGYAVKILPGIEAVLEAESELPSLMIVETELPRDRGVALQQFRHPLSAKVPWIALLDNNSAEHRLLALESGADDSIVKPFSPRDLVARVQALLRPSVISRSLGPVEVADMIIDSWAMKVLVRGVEISTTALEFQLLEYLANHRGQVFTRDSLLDAVWGDTRFVSPRSVDACIRRIREKIEQNDAKPTMLKTIRGVGYRLDAVTAWRSAPNTICNCPVCKTKVGALKLGLIRTGQRAASAKG